MTGPEFNTASEYNEEQLFQSGVLGPLGGGKREAGSLSEEQRA